MEPPRIVHDREYPHPLPQFQKQQGSLLVSFGFSSLQKVAQPIYFWWLSEIIKFFRYSASQLKEQICIEALEQFPIFLIKSKRSARTHEYSNTIVTPALAQDLLNRDVA